MKIIILAHKLAELKHYKSEKGKYSGIEELNNKIELLEKEIKV